MLIRDLLSLKGLPGFSCNYDIDNPSDHWISDLGAEFPPSFFIWYKAS